MSEFAGKDIARPQASVRGRSRRVLRTFLLTAAAVAIAMLVGLTGIGFPRFATRAILARFNRGDYYCDLQRLSLDPGGGIVAHEVRIYRKGIVGPPCVEASELAIRFNLLFWRYRGVGVIRDVRVSGGVVRPAFHRPPAVPVRDKGTPAGEISAKKGAETRFSTRVSVAKLDVAGAWIERGTWEIWREGSAWGISRCSAVVGRDLARGVLRGSLQCDAEGHLRGQCSTGFDPRILIPVMRAFALPGEDILRSFSFSSMPPSCEAAFEYVPGAEPRGHVEGRLQGNGFAYRGAAIEFGNITASFDWSPAGRTLAIKPLVLAVGGREISGAVLLDIMGGTADFEVVSTADILSLLRIAGLPEGTLDPRLKTGRNVRVYGKGRFSFKDLNRTAAELSVEGEGIGYDDFVSDECSFRLVCQGRTNSLTDLKGRLAGGSFSGSAVMMPAGGNDRRYEAKMEVIHGDLSEIISMVSSNAGPRCGGRLYGNLAVTGLVGNPLTAEGQGTLSVKKGAILRLPLFGGMTDALAESVPGLRGVVDQTEVRIPFVIKDGRVWTKEASIDGNMLSLTAKGSVGFDGSLDFDWQVKPANETKIIGSVLRALTSPLSRIFELRLEGTLKEPRWRTALFSKGSPGSGAEGRKDRP